MFRNHVLRKFSTTTQKLSNPASERRMSALEIQHLKRKGYFLSQDLVIKHYLVRLMCRKENRYDNGL